VFFRFQQVKPEIIFTVDEVVYNGKVHQHLPKVATLLSSLNAEPSYQSKVVVIPSFSGDCKTHPQWNKEWMTWQDFVSQGQEKKLGVTANGDIQWWRGPFDWPLWILFSSGTTSM